MAACNKKEVMGVQRLAVGPGRGNQEQWRKRRAVLDSDLSAVLYCVTWEVTQPLWALLVTSLSEINIININIIYAFLKKDITHKVSGTEQMFSIWSVLCYNVFILKSVILLNFIKIYEEFFFLSKPPPE